MNWTIENGIHTRTLKSGITAHLAQSDANYVPGTSEPRLNLNTTALWLRVEAPVPPTMGWWARLDSKSLTRTKQAIDDDGYTLPDSLWVTYLLEGVRQLSDAGLD